MMTSVLGRRISWLLVLRLRKGGQRMQRRPSITIFSGLRETRACSFPTIRNHFFIMSIALSSLQDSRRYFLPSSLDEMSSREMASIEIIFTCQTGNIRTISI
uniref:Uncharacterized protein n=1 Tax=Oryza nivara TaxID=4536 RepID=A0A0E0IC02_ORYNI